MNDFNLADFIKLLNQLKETYPSLEIDVEGFESIVVKEMEEQMFYRVEDKIQFKSIIPNEFLDKRVEFLILHHFKRQFLDGVLETGAIIREFSEVKQISSISIENDEGVILDSLPIKEVSLRKLNSDSSMLQEFFEMMVIELLGDNYNINNL